MMSANWTEKLLPFIRRCLLPSVMVLLASCGGGSDPVTLTVPVSSGYPVLGSTVTIKGANGVSVSATGDAVTGIASFTASQLASLGNPPYLIKSTGGKANGVTLPPSSDYYSVASSSSGRVNVTPITHMLVVQATGSGDLAGMATLFNSGFNGTKAAALTPAALETARGHVKAALTAANPLIDLGDVDPLKVVFSFGDSHDGLLDQVQLTVKNAGGTLDTLQALAATKAAGGTPDGSALQPFKRLVVFGDSLSDGGAYTIWATAAATGTAKFTGSPYTLFTELTQAAPYGGKFTTNGGKVWVEYLAEKLGYDLKPANLMGGGQPSINLSLLGCATCTNYAQGGSRVTLQPGIGNIGTTAGSTDYTITNAFIGASTLPVTQQIDQHLSSVYVTSGRFATTDLVVVLAGANDIFTQAGLAGSGAITSNAAGTAVGTAAGELAAQVVRLKAAGAKHVMVFGLPDMGYTPYGAAAGSATAGALTAFSQSVFNPTLKAALASVQGVAYVDPVPMFAKVVAAPADFGFTRTIDATSPATALASAACGPNVIAQAAAGDSASSPSSLFCSAATLRVPNADRTYMFADGVHPTDGMHKVFARLIKDKMGLLLAAALGGS